MHGKDLDKTGPEFGACSEWLTNTPLLRRNADQSGLKVCKICEEAAPTICCSTRNFIDFAEKSGQPSDPASCRFRCLSSTQVLPKSLECSNFLPRTRPSAASICEVEIPLLIDTAFWMVTGSCQVCKAAAQALLLGRLSSSDLPSCLTSTTAGPI